MKLHAIDLIDFHLHTSFNKALLDSWHFDAKRNQTMLWRYSFDSGRGLEQRIQSRFMKSQHCFRNIKYHDMSSLYHLPTWTCHNIQVNQTQSHLSIAEHLVSRPLKISSNRHFSNTWHFYRTANVNSLTDGKDSYFCSCTCKKYHDPKLFIPF